MRAASLAAAVLGLNFALTFAHVWPTFAIRPTAAVSAEILLLLAVILLLGMRDRLPGPRTFTVLSIVLTAMVATRYAAVTTAGLYGRPVHLYFDLPHVPNVFAMLAKVASPWLLAAGALAIVGLLAAVAVGLRAALFRIAAAARRRAERRGLLAACAALALLALGGAAWPGSVRFAEPFTGIVLTQVQRFGEGLRAARHDELLPAPADFGDAPFAALDGRDVLVVFAESYGAVAFDRPDVREALRESSLRLEQAVATTGRAAVSAFVESPTFAGASWLAHASLMTGGRIDNGGAYQRLLTDERDTLPRRFARAGYRTVALMPGLREPWPEGAFFGFDALYDAAALDYRGPEFGWWRIPDQFAWAKLDRIERRKAARAPLFALFATLSTHVPFRPTPPYHDDWPELAGDGAAFDRQRVEQSLAARPDWLNLTPAYIDSLRYALRTIAGYLEWRADDDFVLIVLGDHQPAASIATADARWDVPVHIIGAPEWVEPLTDMGFVEGLVPRPGVVGPIHTLAPLLLEVFAGPATDEPAPGGYGDTAPRPPAAEVSPALP